MKKKITKKPAKPSARPEAGKPAATGAKLSATRRKLLEMREDLMNTVSKQQVSDTASPDTGDSVDQASQSIEKELLFELSDNERMTLDHIEAALRKIDKGTFGLCESCRKPIAKARLEALPFARYCISCQNTSETVPELAEGPDFRSMGEEPVSREL
jgi:DnaK suppressor protein